MVNIEDLTFGQIKEIQKMLGENTKSVNTQICTIPFKIGDLVMIRSVTNYHIGEVIDIVGNNLKLRGGWVADSGNWTNFTKTSEPDEFELFENDFFVPWHGVIDATYVSKIPKERS